MSSFLALYFMHHCVQKWKTVEVKCTSLKHVIYWMFVAWHVQCFTQFPIEYNFAFSHVCFIIKAGEMAEKNSVMNCESHFQVSNYWGENLLRFFPLLLSNFYLPKEKKCGNNQLEESSQQHHLRPEWFVEGVSPPKFSSVKKAQDSWSALKSGGISDDSGCSSFEKVAIKWVAHLETLGLLSNHQHIQA